ncbi:MAG: 50S ribosomal protein L21, partial [Rhodobacterales bacterium]|nr:50S ribosomal protein L21 [Rhodobacterales bacterium]
RQKLTLVRIGDILESGADATGVKAAIGTGSLSVAALAALGAASNRPAKPEQDRTAKPAKAKAARVATPAADDAEVSGVKPANLLSEAREGGADDLKRISGVGPKLETLLHENGVFHFDQIAAWSPEETAYMDDQLSFKGRIQRDGWLDQATAFAAEKE